MPENSRHGSRAADDEIYVGYLPVPREHQRFLRFTVPCTLWLICAVAFVWAKSQHSPGAGVWDAGNARTLEGVLVMAPYPTLFVEIADEAGRFESTPYLLVEVGKKSADERALGFDGASVRVTGWVLSRDGRKMLELAPEADAIRALDAKAWKRPPMIDRGTVILRGEIVDSKCFLGAMKPGEGKTHKECATLCIKGGIPPMFVARSPQGQTRYFLVTDARGAVIDPSLHPLIGDAVELRGQLVEWGDLNILRVRPEDVQRL